MKNLKGNKTTLRKYELISTSHSEAKEVVLQTAVLTQERAEKLNLFLSIWHRWRPVQQKDPQASLTLV